MAMYSIFNHLNRNDLAELSLAQLFFQRSLSLLPMFIDVAIVKHLDVLYLYWFRYLEHRLFFCFKTKTEYFGDIRVMWCLEMSSPDAIIG